MRSSTMPPAAIVACVLLAGGCGDGYTSPAGVTTPAPTPTPVPTPTPPIDDFAIVGSEPASGGVIHTGVPSNGVTTPSS